MDYIVNISSRGVCHRSDNKKNQAHDFVISSLDIVNKETITQIALYMSILIGLLNCLGTVKSVHFINFRCVANFH